TPVFDPPGGSYLLPLTVSISDASPNTTIYYTTDGSTPTTASTRYTLPIPVVMTTTIKAIAVAPGWSTSNVASATYPTLGRRGGGGAQRAGADLRRDARTGQRPARRAGGDRGGTADRRGPGRHRRSVHGRAAQHRAARHDRHRAHPGAAGGRR